MILDRFFSKKVKLNLPPVRGDFIKLVEKFKELEKKYSERGLNFEDFVSWEAKKILHKLSKKRDKKKRIVFIGSVGVGKSTAISTLTGLIYPKKVKRKNREIFLTKTVLPSGRGRTTLGEFVISQSKGEDIEVEIEPFKEEELREIVRDFVRFMKSYAEGEKAEHSIPLEFLNIFNRLLGLKSGSSKEAKIRVYKQILEGRSEEEAVEEVKRLIHFEERLKPAYMILEAPLSNIKEREKAFKELSEFLSSINRGVSYDGKYYPFPKTLTLEVPETLIDLNGWEIVDTKGLEGDLIERNRALSFVDRIQEKLSDSDNLIVFCSSFVDAPSKYLISVLKNYGDVMGERALEELAKRSLILLLAKGEENFSYDEEEESIEERKLFEVSEKLLRNDLPQIKALVYNSIGGERVADLDFATPREVVWREIEKTAWEYRQKVEEEVYREIELLEREIDRLKRILEDKEKSLFFRELQETEKRLVERIKDIVEEVFSTNFLPREIEAYLRLIATEIGTPTLMALNRNIPVRRGVFPARELNIYTQVFFRSTATKVQSRVLKLVKEEVKQLKEKAVLTGSLVAERIVYSFEEMVESAVSEAITKATGRIKEFFQADEEFWVKVSSEWGKGAGYTNRIVNDWLEELKEEKDYLFKKLIIQEVDKAFEERKLFKLLTEVETFSLEEEGE